jgi:hypothetical protein
MLQKCFPNVISTNILGKDEICLVKFIIEYMAIGIRCSSLYSSEMQRLMVVFYTSKTCSFLYHLNKVLCIDRRFYLLLRIDIDTTEMTRIKICVKVSKCL